jgi:Zn-dependent peptidase ImmA (M78 family)
MSGLRRGFKAEANDHALRLRRELSLKPHEPLCPWSLATHLAVPIVPLSGVRRHEPDGVKYLTSQGKDLFSAVTIFVGKYGRRRIIFHNDRHAKTRQAANLAHELAHAILCHPPTPPFIPDLVSEEEAKWLGPTLLVPNEAALHVVEMGMITKDAATVYGVSSPLMQMRINVSGARIRVQRRRS